jgi:hypothetical protein
MFNSLVSWVWPADRLGGDPGDPRYFTHVGRVVSSMGMGTPDSRNSPWLRQTMQSQKAEIARRKG